MPAPTDHCQNSPKREAVFILLLHDDPGILLWLGCQLVAGGHQALPAATVEGALQLVGELRRQPDLLVINFSLDGAAGLVHAFSGPTSGSRILALTAGHVDGTATVDGVAAIPRGLWEASQVLRAIEQMLAPAGGTPAGAVSRMIQ